jgi:fucose permease
MLEPHPEAVVAAHAERQPLLSSEPLSNGTPKDASSEDILPPRESITLRVLAAMVSFFVMGIHTAAIAVLIPYMEMYYSISDTVVSLLFVTPVTGYILASLFNSSIHAALGRRGIAIIGATCSLLITIVAALHPPYPFFLLAFAVAGFGISLLDAGFCAWAAGLPQANTLSGFLHGSYSAGATLGPYLTSSLLATASRPWYTFYVVMTVPAVLELLLLAWAFRRDTGPLYQAEKARAQAHDPLPSPDAKPKPLYRYPVLYICAAYLIFYVGAEAIVAGWIVTFMLRVRSASPFTASLCASGFWAGMALGRVSLGRVTDRFGERGSVTVYLLGALVAEGVFCLVLSGGLLAVGAMGCLGFWLGPIFPTGIVMLTRFMPRELHVGSVAAVNAVGQVGGAVFPFMVGVVADRWGIGALQPFVAGLSACVLGVWWCFPRVEGRKDMIDAGEE